MAQPNYKSNNQSYKTPKDIYEPILKFINKDKFDLDVCCSDYNIPAFCYYTYPSFDGLDLSWLSNFICFMNPPWNKTKVWLEKAINEIKDNNCEVWCVLPGDRLNTNYFYDILSKYDNWFIATLTGKFHFENPDVSEEENLKNKNNGGLNTPVFILYLGKNYKEYGIRWKKEQPIRSLVLFS